MGMVKDPRGMALRRQAVAWLLTGTAALAGCSWLRSMAAGTWPLAWSVGSPRAGGLGAYGSHGNRQRCEQALTNRGPMALRPLGGRTHSAIIALLRDINVIDAPPPPIPRMPREKKMTELEKQADAIVHAVVAVELLHWHGKLMGTLESAFRKCVYTPVMPRLRRLTNRSESSEDYRIDSRGRKMSRPSRVHDQTLEKQFTLGYVFTAHALRALGYAHTPNWFAAAQYKSRKELVLADMEAADDPAAKDLVAYCAGNSIMKDGEIKTIRERGVGHGDCTPNIWILPVFVDHDRTSHAERQALLSMLEDVPIAADEGVVPGVQGNFRVYASHTPCISCLSSMCQFNRAWEGAGLKVTFDQWKETRRWLGEGPEDLSEEDED